MRKPLAVFEKLFMHFYRRHLKYLGEDEKQDFLDWAIDEGCMPSVKEVSQVSLRMCRQESACGLST